MKTHGDVIQECGHYRAVAGNYGKGDGEDIFTLLGKESLSQTLLT